MRRDDLAGLSETHLITLANAGLYKRARREVEAGRGPKLELQGDDTLVGRFSDGAETRIGRDLAEGIGACTCGARKACRHRLAVVLQYQKEHGQKKHEAWDPGTVSDELLKGLLGPVLLRRARAQAKGLSVRLRLDSSPVAEFATATVVFWAPDALEMARCDCGRRPCAHLALAVWAFRQKPGGGHHVLTLGGEGDARSDATGPAQAAISNGAATSDEAAISSEEAAQVERLLCELLRTGVVNLERSDFFAALRQRARRTGQVWLADALEDLERQKERYERRSALYATSLVCQCVAEITARVRAARSQSLSMTDTVGSRAEERSKPTARQRLIGLGAEVEPDGQRRLVHVYFAEPLSDTVLCMRHEWDFSKTSQTEAPSGRALAKLHPGTRCSLLELSSMCLAIRGARRSASGYLDLARARAIQPTRPPGELWGEVDAPVRIEHLAELELRRAQEPPRLLGPRTVGRDVHVLGDAEVIDMSFSRAEQELMVTLQDGQGTRFEARTHFQDATPGRLGALHAWAEAGGGLLAGRFARERHGWVVRVLGLASPGHNVPVVPDLAAPEGSDYLSLAPAPAFAEHRGLWLELEDVLARGVHRGWDSVRSRLVDLQTRFKAGGMPIMAGMTGRCLEDQVHALELFVASALARELSA